jgi:hypothetical protein
MAGMWVPQGHYLSSLEFNFSDVHITLGVVHENFSICDLICVEHILLKSYFESTRSFGSTAAADFLVAFKISVLLKWYWCLVNDDKLLVLHSLSVMSFNYSFDSVLDSGLWSSFSVLVAKLEGGWDVHWENKGEWKLVVSSL